MLRKAKTGFGRTGFKDNTYSLHLEYFKTFNPQTQNQLDQ